MVRMKLQHLEGRDASRFFYGMIQAMISADFPHAPTRFTTLVPLGSCVSSPSISIYWFGMVVPYWTRSSSLTVPRLSIRATSSFG